MQQNRRERRRSARRLRRASIAFSAASVDFEGSSLVLQLLEQSLGTDLRSVGDGCRLQLEVGRREVHRVAARQTERHLVEGLEADLGCTKLHVIDLDRKA